MRNRAVFNKNQGIEQHFECDFVFIHERVGVIAVEIKGCDDHRYVEKKYNEATAQLKNQIAGLEIFYRLLTGETDSPFSVQGLVCMPNFFTKPFVPETDLSFISNGKPLLHDLENFKHYWKLPNRAFSLTEASIKFITALFGYRRAPYMSSTYNTFEIYRRIMTQDFNSTKRNKKKPIFFTNEQTQAIECTSQRTLISGPPGSGKTLCLLQRALYAAANKDKPGRIILALPLSEELAPKFEEIFASIENRHEAFKRIPEVITSRELNFSPDDDLFYDEMGLKLLQDELVTFQKQLTDRKLTSGSTTVVITGWMFPNQIANMKDSYAIFSEFNHIELKTVIRGTKTIIDEWKNHFTNNEYPLVIGHNILGTSIERYKVRTAAEMLRSISKQLQKLLSPLPTVEAHNNQVLKKDQQYGLPLWAPGDIAVLIMPFYTPESCSATSIRKHLEKNGVQCGSITDQVQNSALVAVDKAQIAVSFEWPIAIVVAISDEDNTHKSNTEYLIATSRTIAKLIVIVVVEEETDAERSQLEWHFDMVPQRSTEKETQKKKTCGIQ